MLTKRNLTFFVLALIFLYLLAIVAKLAVTGAPVTDHGFLIGDVGVFETTELPKKDELNIPLDENISAIAIFRKDGSSVELLTSGPIINKKPDDPNNYSFVSDMLQITSASSNAYARGSQCPSGQQQYCAGPGWFNGQYYGYTCWCQ
jgi:hypothetical protein